MTSVNESYAKYRINTTPWYVVGSFILGYSFAFQSDSHPWLVPALVTIIGSLIILFGFHLQYIEDKINGEEK